MKINDATLPSSTLSANARHATELCMRKKKENTEIEGGGRVLGGGLQEYKQEKNGGTWVGIETDPCAWSYFNSRS